MSLKSDAESALGAGTWKPGLQAMAAADRAHVDVGQPARLRGSAFVDAALEGALPNAARWDYLIGHVSQGEESALWLEVHPASGGANVQEMHAKIAWLKSWLDGQQELKKYPRDIVWVASGRSAYNARSPQIRSIAAQGCRFVGGRLTI